MARLAPLLLVLFVPWGAAAEVPGPTAPSFAELVDGTNTLAGTVGRSWVDTDRRVHAPVVRVLLTQVRTDQGSRRDRLLATFWPLDDRTRSAPRQKTPFRRGERYVFMISDPTSGQRPATVRCLLPILYDPSRRIMLVCDGARRPVVSIGEDRLVVVGAALNGPAESAASATKGMGPRIEVLPATKDRGTRVSVDAFLRAVYEIASRKTAYRPRKGSR